MNRLRPGFLSGIGRPTLGGLTWTVEAYPMHKSWTTSSSLFGIRSRLASVGWESMSFGTERAGKKATTECDPRLAECLSRAPSGACARARPTSLCVKLANEAMVLAHKERDDSSSFVGSTGRSAVQAKYAAGAVQACTPEAYEVLTDQEKRTRRDFCAACDPNDRVTGHCPRAIGGRGLPPIRGEPGSGLRRVEEAVPDALDSDSYPMEPRSKKLLIIGALVLGGAGMLYLLWK